LLDSTNPNTPERLAAAFSLKRFTPAESGWVVLYLQYAPIRGEEIQYNLHALLGWAELDVVSLSYSDTRKAVPVLTGGQGAGALAIDYDPDERFSIRYWPEAFQKAQASSFPISEGELLAGISNSEVAE
jgi:hypothetical protein